MRKDFAALEFKVKKLEKKPKTGEISIQTDRPERWKPFDEMLHDIDYTHWELREQTKALQNI